MPKTNMPLGWLIGFLEGIERGREVDEFFM
jgi:hypothetical protein